jgi:hypothetical protein
MKKSFIVKDNFNYKENKKLKGVMKRNFAVKKKNVVTERIWLSARRLSVSAAMTNKSESAGKMKDVPEKTKKEPKEREMPKMQQSQKLAADATGAKNITVAHCALSRP